MINNNENKKLSRNRKRRIQRRSHIDGNMKIILNKIESEKKKKKKNLNKIKDLEIELVKIEYVKNPKKLKSALKELN